jgi:glycosyltransferase involved in cell wall biosynthesis
VAELRRLRILHTEASLGWGGQEIRVLTEARGVARLGHEVLLAAPADSRIAAEAARYDVQAITLPIGRKRPGGVEALQRLMRERRFDVVNTHSSTDAWLAALACAWIGRGRPPIVRTRHISAPVPRNFATRWLYASTRRIVTTGDRLRDQVIAETGVPPDRVVSIPTGIDLARFSPADAGAARAAIGLPPAVPLVGIVATLRSWKGHRYLIEAIASMARKDVHLAIVGDGPQRQALETLASELGLGSRVTFAGNREDVAPWMRALDVFCLPSYANEGVPQALMQAMACGLPVVTTPVGSIGEIVTDGDTGLLVRPEDAHALRGAVERLLDEPATRAALGARAAAVASERFGEALMVERMLAVFTQAAGHG